MATVIIESDSVVAVVFFRLWGEVYQSVWVVW